MKKIFFKALSVVSLFTLLLNNIVFATSKTSQDVLKDIESLDYNNLNVETLMPLILAHGVFILIFIIVSSCLYIPYMKKIHQPIWKVFIPFYSNYVVYNVGGNGLGILSIVAPILAGLFLPPLAFLATPVLNILLSQKFTNYKGNYLALFLVFLFGPIAIGLGNHQYKG